MRRARLLPPMLVLAAALAPAGCAPSAPGHAATRLSVRLKWLHQAQFAGLYAADKQGYYAAAGLRVAFEPGGLEVNAVQTLDSGRDDFAVWSADQVVIARSRGVPVKAVAVVFQRSPVCFFSRADSAITKPRDFIGRKVAMQYGTNVRTEYVAMMRRAGVPLDSVTEVPTRYGLQPFLRGEVDVWCGYSINEPLVAEENGVRVRLIRPADSGLDVPGDVLVASERTIRDRPQVVRNFVGASLRGWVFALSHRDAAVVHVLERDSRLSRPHERRMLDAAAELVLVGGGVGSFDAHKWETLLTELRAQGHLGSHVVAAPDAYVTQFVNAVPPPEEPLR